MRARVREASPGRAAVRDFPVGPAGCQGYLGIKVTIKATSR